MSNKVYMYGQWSFTSLTSLIAYLIRDGKSIGKEDNEAAKRVLDYLEDKVIEVNKVVEICREIIDEVCVISRKKAMLREEWTSKERDKYIKEVLSKHGIEYKDA